MRAEDIHLSRRSWVRILWLTLRGLHRHGPPLGHDPSITPLAIKPRQKDIDRATCALYAHFIVYMIRHKGRLPDVPDHIDDVATLSDGVQFQLQLALLLEPLGRSDGPAYNTALAAIREGTWASLLPPANEEGGQQDREDTTQHAAN